MQRDLKSWKRFDKQVIFPVKRSIPSSNQINYSYNAKDTIDVGEQV
jgi:hypothetical protein